MKYFIPLITTLFISFNAYCSDNVIASLCNNSTTISQSDLLSCNELTLNSTDWSVQSFTISFLVDGTPNSIVVIGNELNSVIHNSIVEHSPSFIYIEKIILTNVANEEKTLKPFKVKLTE